MGSAALPHRPFEAPPPEGEVKPLTSPSGGGVGVADGGGRAAHAIPVAGQEPFPPLRTVLGFALMAIGMFMAILDIQIVAASLGQIQAGLAASADEISWVQTSYLVAEVVMVPLSGFLSRALSMRRLFLISAAGFVLSSVLCATATTINEMIVYRALQGFIGGAMIPTTYAASFTIFPRRYQTQVTVAIALLVTLAPTVGPTIGGILTDAFSWHWLFLINVIPGLICVGGVYTLFRREPADIALLKRIDIPGLILMALFLMGLDYVLEEGARHDWLADTAVRTVAIIAAFACVGFFWRATTAAEPIVDLRPFRNRNFAGACVLQLTLGVGLFGLTYLYPLFLGRIGQLSAAQIGETLFVTGLTMMLTAPIFGRIARLTDPRLVCSAGFLFMAASTWLTQDLTTQWRFNELILPQILRGCGLMCGIVSTSVIAFATLPRATVGQAAPLFTLTRNIGGAAGLAGLNTLLLSRFDFHWQRIGEHVTMARADIAQRMGAMQAMAEARGLDPDLLPARILARQVAEQATTMSYADAFVVLGYTFVAMAAIPFLLKRPPTFDSPPAEH